MFLLTIWKKKLHFKWEHGPFFLMYKLEKKPFLFTTLTLSMHMSRQLSYLVLLYYYPVAEAIFMFIPRPCFVFLAFFFCVKLIFKLQM